LSIVHRALSAATRRLGKVRRFARRLTARDQLITLVIPCYDVGRYLDDFARSVANQAGGLRNLEIIFVNDGSTDDTLDKLGQAVELLGHGVAKVLSKSNGGICSARNAGLAAARGSWISFPDPDDMLDVNYLKTIRRELKGRPNVAFMAARLVRLYERTGETLDDHPLTFRFRQPVSTKPANDLGSYIHLASNSAFYLTNVVRQHGLIFDERIKPGFEDAHFTNRYLMRCSPDRTAIFLRDALYVYRKRADETSLQDRKETRKEFWLDQSRYGWLGLLQDAERLLGSVPEFVQRTVLYDVLGQVRILLNSPSALARLSATETAEYQQILSGILSFIDPDLVESGTPGLHEEQRVALFNAFYPGHRRELSAQFQEWDPVADLVRVVIYSPSAEDGSVVVRDGTVTPKLWPKRIRHRVFGQDWSFEHIFWTRLGEHIQITGPSGTPLAPKLRGKPDSDSVAGIAIRDALNRRSVGADERQLWLLMDRSDKADDNAEHLYRYLAGNRPEKVAIGFVLDPSSPDWQRLEAEGFNLIAFRGPEHRKALMDATILASSHADPHILRPFDDLAVTHRFVFLQHGVTSQDQSRWFNKIAPSLVLTAAEAEYESIVSQDSLYRLTKKHVALTGFPRHDALLAGTTNPGRSIFIMPTWRPHLGLANSSTWLVRPEFYDSIYVAKWREFLNAPALKHLGDRLNLSIEFCPHPNFSPYAKAFAPPSYVQIVDAKKVPTLQTYLQACAAFVTDYSSTAFDAAHADKPIVYYQFDRVEFFGGPDTGSRGYFDFDRDGFGEVACDADQAVIALAEALSGGDREKYAARSKSFFAFHDQSNCYRATQALLALTGAKPRVANSASSTRVE
jgi:glycosyltransferase involved in cell wall biosynthesis